MTEEDKKHKLQIIKENTSVGKHSCKILSFLFVCFKWLRIEETIHPQRNAA